MTIKQIVKNSIDLHVHVRPEIVPRKFDVSKLVKLQKGKIAGLGIKNHFFPTVSMLRRNNSFIIPSVTLNNYQGGFNSELVRACAELYGKPLIVWFPTINAKNNLSKSKYEIPKEWVVPTFRNKLRQVSTDQIAGLTVLDKRGNLKNEVKVVLETIKKYDLVLATGHISWKESVRVVKYANKIGIKRIIITHPIYQKIDMPIDIQKKLAQIGAKIEQCFSMYSIDKIPIKKIAEQIKVLGAESCIITSDVGQLFSKLPDQALLEFCKLLTRQRISLDDLEVMLVENPKKLTAVQG